MVNRENCKKKVGICYELQKFYRKIDDSKSKSWKLHRLMVILCFEKKGDTVDTFDCTPKSSANSVTH